MHCFRYLFWWQHIYFFYFIQSTFQKKFDHTVKFLLHTWFISMKKLHVRINADKPLKSDMLLFILNFWHSFIAYHMQTSISFYWCRFDSGFYLLSHFIWQYKTDQVFRKLKEFRFEFVTNLEESLVTVAYDRQSVTGLSTPSIYVYM